MKELESILNLAKKLIKFQTTPKNFSEFKKCSNFILNHLSKIPKLHPKIFYFKKIPNLIFSNKKNFNNFDILFQGHLDVIPANKGQFKPVIKDNKLYGRGSLDMKSAVALMLELMKKNEILNSKNTIGLMLTFDEESGGENGAKKLSKFLKGQILINLDGGHGLSLTSASRGILGLEIIVENKKIIDPIFSWQFKKLIDPNRKMIEILSSLHRIYPHQNKIHVPYFSISNIENKESKENLYPHIVKAKVELYFLKNKEEKKFLKIVKRFKNFKFKILTKVEPFFLNINDKNILVFKKILEKNLRRKVHFKIDNGSSDARFFLKKFKSIIITRLEGKNHHQNNEFCEVKSIKILYNTLKEFIREKNQQIF